MTTDEPEPAPEHLSSPGGAPLTALGWADVRTRVAEADDFLLATTDPDGRPHVVPVLGVWLEGAVCFATFRQSRKARNLVRNDGCAVTVPGRDVDLVLEGTARLVRDAARLQTVADLFPAKYPWWRPFVRDGEFHDPADAGLDDPRHVYALDPQRVFAFGKETGFSATRWRPRPATHTQLPATSGHRTIEREAARP
ncbi:pyridoxamine 5'-phosphate oxidase family protein [Pseudonocardia sp. KRD291]|uniref:pyridoxamine 5'-phosphate oxidase family protein n=1 Tax=Pseudonocardia sp. KRD291 TaxID=2792007 RepID=UPI001C4A40AE|nr:pyridoxamine 5'-phosphate oxidase family protein [Pseudonocardia sp. KRD291]MBW0103639.1 pyridoxamine 5'-phosphate oxidase family protein [Pseudonocardia sp. KRD291]